MNPEQLEQLATTLGQGATAGGQQALQQPPRQKGQFWNFLGDFLQGAARPAIPANIVDTTPTVQPQSNTGQIAGYAALGVITLGSVALLIYLIGKK